MLMNKFHKITRNVSPLDFAISRNIKVIKTEEILKKVSNIGSKQIFWLYI